MDFEKRYREAMGRAKEYMQDGRMTPTKTFAEYIFPELKESEDEKIRKFIREQLFKIRKTIVYNSNLDVELANAIAWLEKQGKQNTRWKPSKEQLEALEYASDICLLHERGDYYEDVLDTLRDDLWLLV